MSASEPKKTHDCNDMLCHCPNDEESPAPAITIDPPTEIIDLTEKTQSASIELTETFAEYNSDEPAPAMVAVEKNELVRRIRPGELCVTTRQLATLLRAGMPLVPALKALHEQLQGQPMAKVIRQITDCVNGGDSLADALQKYPTIFSNLFVNMVRVGQASGTLEEVLLKLAEMMEKRVWLAGKIRAALAYPALMVVAAGAVVVFLMAFVIPGIAEIFLDMNRSLPRPTTLLIAVSTFLRTHLLVIALTMCGLVLAVRAYITGKTGKYKWDRFKLKLPLADQLFLKIETTRLVRTLGIMLSSGICILEALKIVKGVVQNSFINASLDNITEDIARGRPIADAIRRTGLFAPIIYHTIAIGEISGNLEEQLIAVAEEYDRQIDSMVRSITSLLEPIILLIMGLVVGFIVLAILLPIFEINQML